MLDEKKHSENEVKNLNKKIDMEYGRYSVLSK